MSKIWVALAVVGAELVGLAWVVGSDAFEWMASGLTPLVQ